MLLTHEQLHYASTLRAGGVDEALVRAGYTDNALIAARFEGMNDSGQFIYDILFSNLEAPHGFDHGRVFLKYYEQPAGIVLLGEF